MRTTVLAIILIVFSMTFIETTHATSYTKSGKISPLKMTYNDVLTILQKINKLLLSSSLKDDDLKCSLSFSDNQIQTDIKLSGDYSLDKIGKLPPIAYNLRYNCSRNTGPIEEVYLRFSDNYREFEIKGNDPDPIDALHSFILTEFGNYSTKLGGRNFRFIGGMLLYIIAFAILIFPTYPAFKLHWGCKTIFIILGISIIVSFFALPYDLWFPGFSIYSDSSSFIIRQSALISFIGVVLTLISIIGPLLLILLKLIRRSSEKSGTKLT